MNFKVLIFGFLLLHGLNGEDGAIHGLLKFTQKPLVGGGILGSALGMDKILMKKIFSSFSNSTSKLFSYSKSKFK